MIGMLGRHAAIRPLIALVSLGLIAAGIWRIVDSAKPPRPEGPWTDIRGLAERDDVNVVFVVLDMLRADRLSTYGYERETSPIMDALASSGIVFENVKAQSSWTKTSMASLWTATHGFTNGVTRYMHGLPDEATLPAEILRDAGYQTVGIWRNGWVAPNFGFGQGFDLYYKPVAKQSVGVRLAQDNPSAFKLGGSDQDLTRAAQAFLEASPQSPFFLYLHYMDIHQYVYDDVANFGTSMSDIYDNSIHWVDRNIGTLWAVLQQQDLMRNTVLVIASDHGEEFGEHGGEGHAQTLYREVTWVPLIVALPFRLEPGIRVQTQIENVDIWPTLLDLLGRDPLPGAQGTSRLSLIEAAAQGIEDPGARDGPLFAELDRTWGRQEAEPNPLITVQESDFRLFVPTLSPERSALFDVATDPWEQENIAAKHPEEVARLLKVLEDYQSRHESVWGGPKEVALDDLELMQLKALGYMIDDKKDSKAKDDEGETPE